MLRPGQCYHIYNRGNNKERIFVDDQDYLNFLKRFKLALFGNPGFDSSRNRIRIKPLPEGAFNILCYCLMPNHYHFLIRQNTVKGIDRLIAKVTTSYAKYFNLRYGFIGNLFQDRFKAKHVDNDSYLTYLSAYIHNNPVDPSNYSYSSFKDYLGIRQGRLCDKSLILGIFGNDVERYRKFVVGYNNTYEEKIKSYLFEE